MDIIDIPAEKVPREDYTLAEIRKQKKITKRDYEVKIGEVSKNIQKFDQKARPDTDPYSFNAVSLKKPVVATPTATTLISNPLYNQAGKILGVDTIHDWNSSYDKVYEIVEWAKKKIKGDNPKALLKFIYDKMNNVPSLGKSKLDDLYIFTGVNK